MSHPIYKSSFSFVQIPDCSIFTHLFNSPTFSPSHIGNVPGSTPAFIDADSGITLSRSTLKSLSLSLGYGLTQTSIPGAKLKKGDVIMIFSPNSITWPVVLFGAVAAGLRCTLANSAYKPNELRHQWDDSCAKVAFVHPSLVSVTREMFRLKGYREDEVRRRVVVAGTEWLTGVKDEGNCFAQIFVLSSVKLLYMIHRPKPSRLHPSPTSRSPRARLTALRGPLQYQERSG